MTNLNVERSTTVAQATLQNLLKDELAAIDAYTQVVDSFDTLCSALDDLKVLRHGHAKAARSLETEIDRQGLMPDSEASGRAGWAGLPGSRGLFQALIQCERLAATEYAYAVAQPELRGGARSVIEELCQQQQHRAMWIHDLRLQLPGKQVT